MGCTQKKIWGMVALGALVASSAWATKLAEVKVIDKDYIQVHFLDGEVIHKDNGQGTTAFTQNHYDTQDSTYTYGTALNTTNATTLGTWTFKSTTDASYGTTGASPLAVYRKAKLNGMAEKAWSGSDYAYQYTTEHYLYLKLPTSLQQGQTYTLAINANTGTDVTSADFTFDINQVRSEAVHVNLVGYSPDLASKAADLYMWLGDGGARDYSTFVGNHIYLYNVNTQVRTDVGLVSFWKASGTEAQNYNMTQSSVWNVDFPTVTDTGTFRLVVDGVGASQDFRIAKEIYKEPFQVSLKGFFYMRIGQDTTGFHPTPRIPKYVPGVSPATTKVYITTAQPYDATSWNAIKANGDPWDNTTTWANYKKSGNPTNANAIGGHADAADWDRHLGHVAEIYDLLLPYILTGGAIDDDNTGIAESGNGVPDVIDEAKYEVDFWLHLRDGQGYSHGVNNPTAGNVFYQAGTTAVAAWANAAMLADAYRIAGKTALSNEYRDSAIAAYTYASGLADQQLDSVQDVGESKMQGRDFKMTAAAYLFNLTGTATYEQAVLAESVCASSATLTLDNNVGYNQVFATAGYLMSPRTQGYPTLVSNMKACVISTAKTRHVNSAAARPSRRSSDNNTGYYQGIETLDQAILAHAVATAPADISDLRKALELEADWSLGRNPLNIIQMTTASTSLAAKRSIVDMYTWGRNDGTPGMQPGHTPYLNTDDWYCGMIMGCPSWMTGKNYPAWNTWPKAEAYFPTRYVYAHSEFTPQQTMRGKQSLYGYLYALGRKEAGTAPTVSMQKGLQTPSLGSISVSVAGVRMELPRPGLYGMRVLDLNGRVLWEKRAQVESGYTETGWMPTQNGLRILEVKGEGVTLVRKLMK